MKKINRLKKNLTWCTCIFSCFVLLCSCIDNDKINEQKFDQATKEAEASTEKISELPLGFYFGMSEQEVQERLGELLASGEIFSSEGDYIYPYQTLEGHGIDLKMNPGFHDDRLYYLYMELSPTHDEDANVLWDDLNKRLDSTYTRVCYQDDVEGLKCSYTKWIKGNQIIFLNQFMGAYLFYLDAPVDRIVTNTEANERLRVSLDKDGYAQSLISPEAGIYKATITDADMLVIAVDFSPGVNFDTFAKTYLDAALRKGVDVKGCLIVDVKDCQFQEGAVIGKRIGKAFK